MIFCYSPMFDVNKRLFFIAVVLLVVLIRNFSDKFSLKICHPQQTFWQTAEICSVRSIAKNRQKHSQSEDRRCLCRFLLSVWTDNLIFFFYSAAFAVSASFAKASLSATAISARTLRFRSMPDFFRPYINLL